MSPQFGIRVSDHLSLGQRNENWIRFAKSELLKGDMAPKSKGHMAGDPPARAVTIQRLCLTPTSERSKLMGLTIYVKYHIFSHAS